MKGASFDNSIPSVCSGVVHSVFENAVNISAACGLVSVVNKKYFNGPNRIVAADLLDFRKISAENDTIRIENGRLVFPGGAAVKFGNSSRWRSKIKKIADGRIDTSIITGYLESYSFVKPEIIGRFRRALELSDADLLNSTVGGLTGLGSGLTPSGDDFLVGFISAGHFFNGRSPFDFFLKNLKIDYAKTNFISAEYLRYSCEGRISEVITNTVVSISERKPDSDFWLSNLVNTGAASGKDTLFGILTAMEVYNVFDKSGEKKFLS